MFHNVSVIQIFVLVDILIVIIVDFELLWCDFTYHTAPYTVTKKGVTADCSLPRTQHQVCDYKYKQEINPKVKVLNLL